MKKAYRLARILLLVFVAFFCTVCVSDKNDSDTPIVEYTQDAIPVEETDVLNWVVLDNSITIPVDDSLASTVMPGKVLVGGSFEKHFLRRIVSIEEAEGELVLHTEHASLTDAFSHLEVDFSTGSQRTVPNGIQIYRIIVKPEVSIDHDWEEDITQEFDEEDEMPAGWTVNFVGNFGYSLSMGASAKVDLKLIIKNSILNEARISATGAIDFELTETLKGSSTITKTVEHQLLPAVNLMRINLYGVWIDLMGSIDAGIEFELDTDLEVTCSQQLHGKMTVGIGYDGNEWYSIEDKQFTTDFSEPTLSTSMKGTVRPYISPKLAFEFFGIAGPFISMQGYGKLTGVVQTSGLEISGNMDFSIGYSAIAGGQLDVLGMEKDLSFTLFSWEKSLWSISSECAEVENGEYLVSNNAEVDTVFKDILDCQSKSDSLMAETETEVFALAESWDIVNTYDDLSVIAQEIKDAIEAGAPDASEEEYDTYVSAVNASLSEISELYLELAPIVDASYCEQTGTISEVNQLSSQLLELRDPIMDGTIEIDELHIECTIDAIKDCSDILNSIGDISAEYISAQIALLSVFS